jgi:Tol biopolymer transport system component
LLLALACGAAPAHGQPGPAPGWTLSRLTPADAGTRGARTPYLTAAGDAVAFQHDGNLVTGPPANPDGNAEIFTWRAGAGLAQLTDTSAAMGGFPRQARPSSAGDGRRIAFLSNADLTGANADRSAEAYVWDAGFGFRQLSQGPAGSAAEGPVLSRDGHWVAFWHTADLTGANPDRGLELFRARVGPAASAAVAVEQLTDLTSSPYHSLPTISGDGARVAFVLEADLNGQNADGSWEIFLWQDTGAPPGAPSSFLQITDWHPPMTGREVYDPSVSDDGRRVAFGGRGHVDVSQPGSHVANEIYLWQEGTGLRRLTTATGSRLSSTAPRISADGSHVFFVSLADLDATPGNRDESAELFAWSECGPVAQLTASANRPNIIATDPELIPGADGAGSHAAFVSETESDPSPLVLLTRRGILFHAREDDPSPCAGPPGPTAPASPTLSATTAPTAPPTPVPTWTPPHPDASATPDAGPRVCPQAANLIPPVVQARALAQPEAFYGWGLPANPSLPPGPRNPMRAWLSVLDIGKPFGPANGAVWKAGCP